MSDYVSRQYLLDEYDRQHQGPPGGARKIIAEAPAEDVAQVVHGRWIEYEGEGYHGIHCSRCNFSIPYGNVMMGYNFCPNCGAKMEVDTR